MQYSTFHPCCIGGGALSQGEVCKLDRKNYRMLQIFSRVYFEYLIHGGHMNIIIAIVGLIVGLYAWSNIIGSLFAVLPLRIELKRIREIQSIDWPSILAPVIVSSAIFIIPSIFSKFYLYGSIVAAIIVLFKIKKLKDEALDNEAMRDKK
jgi:sensor histidine kinase YesM